MFVLSICYVSVCFVCSTKYFTIKKTLESAGVCEFLSGSVYTNLQIVGDNKHAVYLLQWRTTLTSLCICPKTSWTSVSTLTPSQDTSST